jgi:hypothetical protein
LWSPVTDMIIFTKIINRIVFLFFFGKFYVHDSLLIIDCMELILIKCLVISTSHGLLNLQATMPSAISRFVMLMLCQFPSLSVHDSGHNIFFFTFTIPRKVSVYNYFCFVFVFDVLFFLYLFVYFFVLFLFWYLFKTLIECKC